MRWPHAFVTLIEARERLDLIRKGGEYAQLFDPRKLKAMLTCLTRSRQDNSDAVTRDGPTAPPGMRRAGRTKISGARVHLARDSSDRIRWQSPTGPDAFEYKRHPGLWREADEYGLDAVCQSEIRHHRASDHEQQLSGDSRRCLCGAHSPFWLSRQLPLPQLLWQAFIHQNTHQAAVCLRSKRRSASCSV